MSRFATRWAGGRCEHRLDREAHTAGKNGFIAEALGAG
jgi:hypothetical protein